MGGAEIPRRDEAAVIVLLTVLVTHAIVGLSDAKLASDDDALAAVLTAIVTRLDKDSSVPNPVNTKEILSDRLSKADFADFLANLKAFQNTADNACKATELITASDIWTDAFEHFFPPPEAEELNEALASRSALSKAVARVTFDPIIAVTAQGQKNANAKFSGTNKIGPIPKDCDIRFTVTNARDLPVGAEIQWMVRNEGIEAEIKNDLGHLAGTGTTQTEQSAYNGTHYMDCVVKLRGQADWLPAGAGPGQRRGRPAAQPAKTPQLFEIPVAGRPVAPAFRSNRISAEHRRHGNCASRKPHPYPKFRFRLCRPIEMLPPEIKA